MFLNQFDSQVKHTYRRPVDRQPPCPRGAGPAEQASLLAQNHHQGVRQRGSCHAVCSVR
jgi:hypothetical protein